MLPVLLGLESHVSCLSISGSCMRLDISPALMFSCQFTKLVKKHLIICHKSGMFDDDAIFLCDCTSGSLYYMFQWVIPVSSFPFLGYRVFPDDVGQRDTGYPITLTEELSIPSKVFGQSLSLIMVAMGSSQLPSESHNSLMMQMAWTVKSAA